MIPLVAVRGVTKIFPARRGAAPVTALDDVSLDIPANAFVTLLGPSGCGKTTLLRMIAGFEHPDRGDIKLDDTSILAAPPNRRPVNIVFQSYALFPHMSVADNIGFGLARQGHTRPVIAARVREMLALVQLDALGSRRPAELSGGQQQRVALARALAPAPRLLLLDEPLSALDLKLRRGMQVELKRLQRETGITFLLVTHDQEEALAMSDVIAVMQAGHIEQIGAPAEIFAMPRSRFVADFFGANVLEGQVAGHEAAWVALRPEQVEVTRPGIYGHAGRVTALSYHGTATACAIALADGPTIEALRSDLPPSLVLRDEVAVRWPRDALVPLEP